MLAQRFMRPARQLQSQVRKYATEPTPQGGGNALLYTLLGAGAVGGGYYYFARGGSAPKVANLAPAKPTFTGGEQGFVSLKLASVEDINHNSKRFRFELPEENNVSGLKIASALLTKHQGEDMKKPVLRPYTPVSDEDQRGYLDLLVKSYPNGPMSEHIHAMKPGDTLDMKGPLPKYPWESNKHEHIGLIAGGTGITPMWQLTRAILKNPEDKTKVTLVYGNVSEDDILLRKELESLEAQYPGRFNVYYTLDKPSKDWLKGKGFINKDVLKQNLPGPNDGNIKVFVCGPPGLYKVISGEKTSPKDQGELTGILKDLGYNKDQVYKF